MKEGEMCRTCSVRSTDEKCIQIFFWETWRE